MKFTSKKELVEHYVNSIKNIESVKRITISTIITNWDVLSSTFNPKISKNCPTKKERIIKNTLSLIRNNTTWYDDPISPDYKIDVKNIKEITFKCEYA